MKLDLLDELSRRPLVCDGAMGTELVQRGLAPGACGELWNVENPDAVQAIHRAYLDAGCNLVTTNTFGACGAALERHHLSGRVREINVAGARAARKAAGESAWVLGDVGPFGGFLEPYGETDHHVAAEWFRQQIASLYEGGADAVIIETMSDTNELGLAVQSAREVSSKPVIATFAFAKADGDNFRTMTGALVEDALQAAIKAGADVVGANCGTSLNLDDYLRLAGKLVQAAGDVPTILQPNAGSPSTVNGKLVYPATPAEMAGIVKPLLKIGVKIIGGCCGTSPAHLKAMSAAI